jgi:hypothetical protein
LQQRQKSPASAKLNDFQAVRKPNAQPLAMMHRIFFMPRFFAVPKIKPHIGPKPKQSKYFPAPRIIDFYLSILWSIMKK